MDAVISSISAPQPVLQPQADMRPTADSAALARDATPNIAMAIPASMGQSGAVNASRITDSVSETPRTEPTERVLKPYGVAMLPERPSEDQAMSEVDSDAETQTETTEESDPVES